MVGSLRDIHEIRIPGWPDRRRVLQPVDEPVLLELVSGVPKIWRLARPEPLERRIGRFGECVTGAAVLAQVERPVLGVRAPRRGKRDRAHHPTQFFHAELLRYGFTLEGRILV